MAEGGSWRSRAAGEQSVSHYLSTRGNSVPKKERPQEISHPRVLELQNALQSLHLQYNEFIPAEPVATFGTVERWHDVLARVTSIVTLDDAWSHDKKLRRWVQDICYGVLGEESYWNANIRLSGRFLSLLDSTIIAAKEHGEYYDTALSQFSNDALRTLAGDPLHFYPVDEHSFIIEDPDSLASNPLLRRKVEAMNARQSVSLPHDPTALRNLYLQFPRITLETSETVAAMSDEEIFRIDPYLTGDEGVTEYLWTQVVRSLDTPMLRKNVDDAHFIITQIAPEKVGAFDAMGRLLGVRNIQDFRFVPVDKDPDLALPDIADDITFTFDIGMREQFSKDFGFPIEQLTLREQVSVIGTLRKITAAEEKRIIGTIHRFGIDGARAFLSTEFGDGFRGTVLAIAEKFSEDDAKQIFKSFSEIVTFAQETADTLGKRFFAKDKTYNADAVRTELLSRAKDLLVTAESADASSITSKLARFKSDIVLFASMFKITQKGQDVKFEDIKDVHLESVSSNELTDADKASMVSILTENWSKQAPELLESTRKSLEDSFKNPRSRFVILRKGNNIAASVRFDEQDHGSLYAGSLNVNDVYRSSGIGEAMLQSTIDSLAKTHVITAHVPASLPVAMKYVNDFGLNIVGIDEEIAPDGTVIRDLKLERDDEKNRHYGAHPHIERFDLSHGDDAILDAVARQTAHGQVATKYFSDPLNPTLRYIAFEAAVTFSQERQAA